MEDPVHCIAAAAAVAGAREAPAVAGGVGPARQREALAAACVTGHHTDTGLTPQEQGAIAPALDAASDSSHACRAAADGASAAAPAGAADAAPADVAAREVAAAVSALAVAAPVRIVAAAAAAGDRSFAAAVAAAATDPRLHLSVHLHHC